MESLSIKKCCDELLDLGKRNRLLYFAYKGPFVKIEYAEKINLLFKKLEDGESLHVYSFDPMIQASGKTQVEFNSDEAIRDEVTKNAKSSYESMSNRDRYLFVTPKKAPLNRALRTLRTTALSSLDERGINIMFLSFGMLRWKEREDPLTEIYSPLLMMPVELVHNANGNFYSIKEIDGEDVVANNTLRYKLKADYQLDIPEFDNEQDDLLSYLDKVKNAISKYADWIISKDETYLGLFTFSKIDMYKDLKDNEQTVIANPIVANLFDASSEPLTVPQNQNEGLKEEETSTLHNVIDADSSQMEAIQLSKKGVSFVLQGPPGTGKSQTITNIIAEALYDGKKVLFVSEKKAALDVVYTKLKNAALDDFCLSLHGSKANKKDVLSEIKRVLMMDRTHLSLEAKNKLNELEEEKEILDNYSKELSVSWESLSMTTYQILGMADKYQSVVAPTYLFDDIESKGLDFLKDSTTLLKDIGPYLNSFGREIDTFPYYGYKNLDAGYHERMTFTEDLKENLPHILTLRNQYDALAALFDLKKVTLGKIKEFNDELEAILKITVFDKNIFKDIGNIHALSLDAMEKLSKEEHEHDALIQENDVSVLDLDHESYRNRFKNDYASSFKRLFSVSYHKEIKNLMPYHKGKKLSYKEALNLFDEVKQYQESKDEAIDAFAALNEKLDNKDLVHRNNIADFIQGIEGFQVEKTITFKKLASLKYNDFTTLQEKLASLERGKDFSSVEKLSAYFDENSYKVQEESLDDIYQKFLSCQDRLSDFDRYLKFFRLIGKVKEAHLDSFIRLYLKAGYDLDKMDEGLKKVFFLEWAHHVLESSPTLREISREKHDKIVAQFKKNDLDAFKINQAQIRDRVDDNLPVIYDSAVGMVGDFLRDANKKRNIPAIRRILLKYQELIQQVKPCFMMSPLTVSTFLTKDYHFDLVVFDEASQVFPWDAIGAIYRSKQAIIVGDNKQMPPTSFFLTNSFDEEDCDVEDTSDVSSFESILDFCATFPQRRLLWHYRSKSEDLISFSNKNFYQDTLVTFPSSTKKKEGFGVDFYFVDKAIYNRKQRVNRLEAERVVDLIYEDIEKHPNDSLGVVVMNISQQDAIEDALEKRRLYDDCHHDFFENRDQEPFFIKNLETVQGDERDRMIISIGYGYDEKGNFYHNFGPLNRIGGERRLNVAITRAKYNVQVVSSIHSYDIKEEKTNALGPRLLKQYLDYAENPSLHPEVLLHDETNSAFESDVAESLRTLGYVFDTQVGSSLDKIDFGIRHPFKDAYVMALECDGASYHKKAITRDRDRLRQQVLELQGFSFYRLWSNDWFINKKREEAKLKEAIDQAIKDFDRKNRNVEIPLRPVEEKEEEEVEPVETPDIAPAREVKAKDFMVMEDSRPVTLASQFRTYQPCPITAMASTPITNELEIAQIIDLNMRNILLREQPMREDYLLRKLSKLTGRTKMTSAIKRNFEKVKKYRTYNDLRSASEDETTTYWLDDEVLQNDLRLGGNRKMEEIPNCELENGLVHLLQILGPVTQDDLVKAMTSLLGFNRASEAITKRLNNILASLLHCSRIGHDSDDKLTSNK